MSHLFCDAKFYTVPEYVVAGMLSVDKGASDVVTRIMFVIPTDSFSLHLLFNILSSIEPAMYWGCNMIPY